MITVPIEVSNRHLHLSEADASILFGKKTPLHVRRPISQTGQFAAQEVVTLVGPKGKIEHVRVVGPYREATQVEIAGTDAKVLGINPPLRDSGDLKGSGGIQIIGTAGSVDLVTGVIRQRRHIHATEEECRQYGVQVGERQRIRVHGYTFDDVHIKVHPSYRWRFHVDTDEALLANIRGGELGEIVS